ncbi:MAG TPA: peptidoglycan-associated lipoprotein, partial [Hyphomicrobiales bacterium]|nr:peptidoglycan-associated lipoprotein [Hyphomicrobiales bacterium]
PVAVCDDISCWSQNRRTVTVLGGGGAVASN